MGLACGPELPGSVPAGPGLARSWSFGSEDIWPGLGACPGAASRRWSLPGRSSPCRGHPLWSRRLGRMAQGSRLGMGHQQRPVRKISLAQIPRADLHARRQQRPRSLQDLADPADAPGAKAAKEARFGQAKVREAKDGSADGAKARTDSPNSCPGHGQLVLRPGTKGRGATGTPSSSSCRASSGRASP